MTLKIAMDAALTNIVSTDGTNPITTQHSINGETKIVQLWLFNNDSTHYYTGVNVDPTDTTGTDESTWIQLSSDGTNYQLPSAALSFANIGAPGTPDTTGHMFYAKITSPSGQTVQNKTDIKLTVNFTEFAV